MAYLNKISIVKATRQDGFTLIEILIGMTLLGIMLALLFGAFRTGISSWETGEKRAVEIDNILVVQNFLRARLSAAQPLIDDFSDDEAEFSFKGTRESVQFVSTLRANNGLTKFLVFFDRPDNDKLKISVKPFFPTFDDTETADEDLVLLEDIDRVELSYYGANSFGEDLEWTDRWEDKDSFPRLVKLEIRFKDKAESVWPPMIVRLRIDSSNVTTGTL